ncbi:hypothetical protein [uncultured Ruegeria sp.]|uniref:hypothetical protein n=1 Tax=uncultured Ruegeria sp. TaxID=259304 RepID=UPI00260814BC|nr:hypothetical protein [uncultured Ruegeria sp.]
MTSPNDANEHCLLCDAWSYLTSDDMVLNLTSEMIGIIVTLVLITLLGGWYVRRAAAKSFDRKWAAFRADTAASILEGQKQLDDDYFYLGQEMLRISEKPTEEINTEDLETFRRKRAACKSRGGELASIFERTHFALRETDVALAAEFISTLRVETLEKLADGFSDFEQFDTRLAMHLQGLAPLHDHEGGKAGPTYRDVLLSAARGAEKAIANIDRTRVLHLSRSHPTHGRQNSQ